MRRSLLTTTILTVFILAFAQPVAAQQNRVDSILAVLQKTDVTKSADSAMFTTLITVIEKTMLNDADVAALEKAAEKLTSGNTIHWNYLVKLSIMNSLIKTDKAKAIAYGKHTYESLKTSKTTEALIIRSYFFRQLRVPYRTGDLLDEGFIYFNGKLKEFQLENDSLGLSDCYYVLGGFYRTKGLVIQAIYNMKKSISYLTVNTPVRIDFSPATDGGIGIWVNNHAVAGIYYYLSGNYDESLRYSRIAFKELSKKDNQFIGNVGTYIALAKLMSGTTDSVEYFLDNTLQHLLPRNYDGKAFALQAKGLYKIKTNQLDEADSLLQQCWRVIQENNLAANSPSGILDPDYYLSLLKDRQHRIPEAIVLLQKDLERVKGLRMEKLRDYKLLSALYEQQGDLQQANLYNKSFIALQDSLLQDQKKYGTLSFETEQQISANELSITKLQSENKISSLTRNFTIGIAALFVILAAVIFFRFKSKQKDNIVLAKTLADLKLTQSQLVQSEKMASLGELTAGIAHEIQNPLNFVNNFSEVNTELLVEMKDEMDKGNLNDAKAIANDVIDNEKKINHHGKRADAIVKGMLQHSRSSNGVKEPTDINALADEYLRLSYHGLRAKDKSFNAAMKTDFDQSIGNINIIPQDIGRVVLNLINNAFYVVDEKKKLNSNGYEPTVSVSTKRINARPDDPFGRGEVEISVKDNGNGIPQKVLDKIFQPFFTTKPTGQGTGLGLSLSYDIVKAHGGELKVETREACPPADGETVGRGEGSIFIIKLPYNNA